MKVDKTNFGEWLIGILHKRDGVSYQMRTIEIFAFAQALQLFKITTSNAASMVGLDKLIDAMEREGISAVKAREALWMPDAFWKERLEVFVRGLLSDEKIKRYCKDEESLIKHLSKYSISANVKSFLKNSGMVIRHIYPTVLIIQKRILLYSINIDDRTAIWFLNMEKQAEGAFSQYSGYELLKEVQFFCESEKDIKKVLLKHIPALINKQMDWLKYEWFGLRYRLRSKKRKEQLERLINLRLKVRQQEKDVVVSHITFDEEDMENIPEFDLSVWDRMEDEKMQINND